MVVHLFNIVVLILHVINYIKRFYPINVNGWYLIEGSRQSFKTVKKNFKMKVDAIIDFVVIMKRCKIAKMICKSTFVSSRYFSKKILILFVCDNLILSRIITQNSKCLCMDALAHHLHGYVPKCCKKNII